MMLKINILKVLLFLLFFYGLFYICIWKLLVLHTQSLSKTVEKNSIFNVDELIEKNFKILQPSNSALFYKNLFYKNNVFMFNYHITQYSSYIIDENTDQLRIEAMIMSNLFSIHLNDVRCLLFSSMFNEIYVLNIQYINSTSQFDIKKIICTFNKAIINIKDELAVAIISSHDFDLDKNLPDRKYPIEMINFQIPNILYAMNPRLPQVGVCLQYVSKQYHGILDWIKLNKNYDIAKLILYDGTYDQSLKMLINDSNDEGFLKLINNFTLINHCNLKSFLVYEKLYPKKFDSYINKCKSINGLYYQEKFNQISSNDCYIQLKYIYEFVALYDLDELIIPRNWNNGESDSNLSCLSKNKICMQIKKSLNMYDYIKSLVKSYFSHEISRLRSIEFQHAAYFLPNELQNSLMNKIKSLAHQIETNSLNESFPIFIQVANSNNFFTVEENQTNFIIKLSKLSTLFDCYYESYLKQITNFDINLVRYLYFITGNSKRLPKSIHFTRNVYTIFTHYALHYEKDSIILNAETTDGHVNSHFRLDLSVFFRKYDEIPITTINFDFEYVYFLLKNYTNFC